MAYTQITTFTTTIEPKCKFVISREIERTSNSQIKVRIKVDANLTSSGSWIGGGGTSGHHWFTTTVQNGGEVSNKLKESTVKWEGTAVRTVINEHTVSSSSAGATYNISFKVTSSYFTAATFSVKYSTITTPALLYTSCSAPTSVTASKTLATPGSSITISWSGAKSGTNNTVNGYTIYWRDGSQPTTSTYTGSASTTSTSYSAASPNTRGTTRYFKVMAKGTAGSSYYSAISTASAYCTTNSLPTISSISVDKTTVKSTGDYVKFTINASDSNGGTLYYRYNTTNSMPSTNNFTNGSSLWVNNDQKTYYFWAVDNMGETSSVSLKTIMINTAPEVSTFNTSGNGTIIGNINRSSINTSTWTLNKSCNYSLYSISNNISTLIYSGVGSSGSYSHSISQANAGKSYTYRLDVSDAYETGTSLVSSSTFTAPSIISGYSLTCTNNSSTNISGSQPNQFNNILYSTYSGSRDATTTATIRGYYLEYGICASATSSPTSWLSISASSLNSTYPLDFTMLSRGSYIKTRLKIIDNAGYESEYFYGVKTDSTTSGTIGDIFLKANLPLLFDTNNTNSKLTLVGIERNFLKPLSDSLEVSFPQSPLNENVNIFNKTNISNFYLTLVNIGSISNLQIPLSELTNETSLNNIAGSYRFTIDSDKLKSKISNLLNKNTIYSNCQLSLQVKDAFGNYSPIKNLYSYGNSSITYPYLTIDFREAPIWSTGITPSMTLKTPDETGQISWEEGTYPLVNVGEKIEFIFPNYSDKNSDFGGDTFTKKLYYKRTNTQNSLSVTENDTDWIDAGSLFNPLTSTFTASTLIDGYNTIYRFAAKVFDSTGLSTSFYVYDKGIELCRKVNSATIALNEVSFGDTTDTGAEIDFKSNILDLGGSLIDPSRSLISPNEELDYTYRRNFERAYTGYSKTFIVNLVLSENKDFSNEITSLIYTYSSTTNYLFGEFNRNGLGIINGLSNDKSYYVKLRFEYSKDSYDNPKTTIYESNTLYLLGAAPLVAYRKEQLGINTKTIDTNAAVHIKRTQTNDKIVLEGIKSTSEGGFETSKIILDLSTGLLSGDIIINLSDNDNW